ncbi:hypothetical protein [Streptomyces atacamensis]|uniref:hypothetical protein n=1 Tax=Streptomyces atacamensis TaxID=531966 RepID=UPI00399D1E0F
MGEKRGVLAAAVVCAMAVGLTGCSGGPGGTGGPESGPGGGFPLGIGGTDPAAPGEAGEKGDAPLTGGFGRTRLERSSAGKIMERAAEAMREADSLRVTGWVAAADDGRMTIDLALAGDGECTGTMTVGGGTAEILAAEGQTYMKGDERFWESRSDGGPGEDMAVEMLSERWVKTGPGESGAGPGAFCDLDGLLEDMESGGSGETGKREPVDLDGREAIPLVQEEDGEGTTTAYVANDDDRPYLLRMENEGSDEPGVMEFTGHGEEVVVEAPDPDEVLDLSEMREDSGRHESV